MSAEPGIAAAAAKPFASSGGFAPLRHTVFAVAWTATVLGSTGSFMRDVASSWIVTDLSAAPAAVAMVQVAGSLPIFLLAIPAGVLSDILDQVRRPIVQHFLALRSDRKALTDESTSPAAREGTP
jgi:MFS family permease